MARTRPWLAGVVVALILSVVADAAAAARAEPWARWTRHDPTATATIDHGAWAAFLERYRAVGADGVARIAYCRVTPADRAALDAYLDALAATPISSYARDEQMAYWINLYNALMVRLVLDHYPVRSVRDIDPAPGRLRSGPWKTVRSGPWRKKLITVEGEALSLNDIEQRILRPIWRDPRLYYALSCGALGCPNLAAEPYRGAELDHQLNRAAAAYVNDPRGVTIDDGRLVVSRLYTWFQEDFGGSEKGVLRHLKAFADPELAMRLERFDGIDDDRYDWALNLAEGC